MKYLLPVSFAIVTFFLSCKKDGTGTPADSDHFEVPATKGSWWVYDWYSIDTAGVATPTSMHDSVYISRDTTANGHRFVVIEGTFLGQPGFKRFERDSAGFIVGVDGTIHYSYEEFETVFEEGNFMGFIRWKDRMHDSVMVTVPAGDFETVEARRTHFHASGVPINHAGIPPSFSALTTPRE